MFLGLLRDPHVERIGKRYSQLFLGSPEPPNPSNTTTDNILHISTISVQRIFSKTGFRTPPNTKHRCAKSQAQTGRTVTLNVKLGCDACVLLWPMTSCERTDPWVPRHASRLHANGYRQTPADVADARLPRVPATTALRHKRMDASLQTRTAAVPCSCCVDAWGSLETLPQTP